MLVHLLSHCTGINTSAIHELSFTIYVKQKPYFLKLVLRTSLLILNTTLFEITSLGPACEVIVIVVFYETFHHCLTLNSQVQVASIQCTQAIANIANAHTQSYISYAI